MALNYLVDMVLNSKYTTYHSVRSASSERTAYQLCLVILAIILKGTKLNQLKTIQEEDNTIYNFPTRMR